MVKHMNADKKYLEFASNLSFFEFTQEEFYNANFNIEKYSDEIKVLESTREYSIEKIEVLLEKYPRLFTLLEGIFQLRRFTNVQLINLIFDVEILNSQNEGKIIDYIKSNLNEDAYLNGILDKLLKKHKFENINFERINREERYAYIKLFKEAITIYIDNLSKKRDFLYARIKKMPSVRMRIAKYLIKNLKLHEMVESINIKSYLKNKRIPIDTKSIHGKFGSIKITKTLNELGIIDANGDFKKLGLGKMSSSLTEKDLPQYRNKWIFVSEKYINNILKRKQKKLKKFDFVILYDLKIKYLIETNFFSTSGTKIGINEEEYIDLNEEIIDKIPTAVFMWITDGNYWLTSDGESRFKNLYEHFGENILNYNLFKKRISKEINNS